MTFDGRRAWARFVHVAKPYWTSEGRGRALGLLAALLTLLLAITGLNIAISYVGRDFMTALADRQPQQLYEFALLYLVVFGAAAVTGALARFTELLLGLRWREWLTQRFLNRYLAAHAYFHINRRSDVDNPDQRIAEDVRTFTATALSFLVMATNAAITIVAFTGVLWSITPWLVLADVLYPLLGTALIVRVGRRLVGLNNLQLKREADFRFELVHVRTHAEAVALAQSEDKEQARLRDRLGAVVANFREIITVARNLEFVTGAYNYLPQLIPVLIVAPLYLRGQVEFGVVTQAAMAFSQVFNAFSLVATKFQDLSTFAAVVHRVGALDEALAVAAEPSAQPVQVAETDDPVAPLAYRQVTLHSPQEDRPLVRDLSLEVPPRARVALTGPPTAGSSALMLATAGLWVKGSGRVDRPRRRRVLFLPEQPYLVPGTLRDQFVSAEPAKAADGRRIAEVLGAVGLATLVGRLGGLDVAHDWATALALGERQLVAFARLLAAQPDFAFLDHATSALDEAQRERLYELLARRGISYICVGDCPARMLATQDTVLELRPDGTWVAAAAEAGRRPAS